MSSEFTSIFLIEKHQITKKYHISIGIQRYNLCLTIISKYYVFIFFVRGMNSKASKKKKKNKKQYFFHLISNLLLYPGMHSVNWQHVVYLGTASSDKLALFNETRLSFRRSALSAVDTCCSICIYLSNSKQEFV